MESYLRQYGLPIVRAPNASGDKAAIMATIGLMQDGGIVLSGHTDCVPVEGQKWTGDPFRLRREGGRIYGRRLVRHEGFRRRRARHDPGIHGGRSESRSTSCSAMTRRRPAPARSTSSGRFGADLPKPSVTLVGEPTLMQVADAHKSCLDLCISVRGHESHLANCIRASAPHVGARLAMALEKIGAEIAEESASSERFDPPVSTVHVGIIGGGTARNIMARDCGIAVGVSRPAGRVAAHRLQQFMLACDEIAQRRFKGFPDCEIVTQIEVEIPALAPEPGSPAAETLVLRLSRQNRTVAVPYASEAGQFQLHDLPTVLCGPGSIEQAHQADEYCEIAQIEECVAFLRRLAAELSRARPGLVQAAAPQHF